MTKKAKPARPIENVIILVALLICATPIGVYAGLHALIGAVYAAGGEIQPLVELVTLGKDLQLIIIGAAVGVAFKSFADRLSTTQETNADTVVNNVHAPFETARSPVPDTPAGETPERKANG